MGRTTFYCSVMSKKQAFVSYVMEPRDYLQFPVWQQDSSARQIDMWGKLCIATSFETDYIVWIYWW